MKYDFDQEVLTVEGTPFDPPARIKAIVFTALCGQIKGDELLSPEKKLELFSIAVRCHKGGEVELSAEEITIIKQRAGGLFSIHLFGRLVQILESADGRSS